MTINRESKDTVQVMITPQETGMVRRAAGDVGKKYCGAMYPSPDVLEDLYHYGIIGLLEAKKRFDSTKKFPFLVFAARRVRGEMIDHLRKDPVIRLPQLVRRKVKELQQARHDLVNTHEPVTDELVAQKLGWSVQDVREAAATAPRVFSVSERQVGPDAENASKSDMDIVADNPGPEAITLRRELAEIVQQCLEAIASATDRLILVSRLLHNLKLRELAETMDCSIENVRLRQKKGADQIRQCLEQNGWNKKSLAEMQS